MYAYLEGPLSPEIKRKYKYDRIGDMLSDVIVRYLTDKLQASIIIEPYIMRFGNAIRNYKGGLRFILPVTIRLSTQYTVRDALLNLQDYLNNLFTGYIPIRLAEEYGLQDMFLFVRTTFQEPYTIGLDIRTTIDISIMNTDSSIEARHRFQRLCRYKTLERQDLIELAFVTLKQYSISMLESHSNSELCAWIEGEESYLVDQAMGSRGPRV